jgi:hypothetical protein
LLCSYYKKTSRLDRGLLGAELVALHHVVGALFAQLFLQKFGEQFDGEVLGVSVGHGLFLYFDAKVACFSKLSKKMGKK